MRNTAPSLLKRVETQCFFVYKIEYTSEIMSFTVRLELPPEIEQRLRKENPDISKEVQEAFVLELFRRGKISHYELSSVLGLSRLETDAHLKLHKVFEGSLTNDDLEADYQTLRQLHLKNS